MQQNKFNDSQLMDRHLSTIYFVHIYENVYLNSHKFEQLAGHYVVVPRREQ